MVIATSLSPSVPQPVSSSSRSMLKARLALRRDVDARVTIERAPTVALVRSNPVAAKLGTTMRCPCCQASAASALPICYGMVAPSVVEQARRGEWCSAR